MKSPIVVCSTTGTSAPVLAASIKTYAPDHPVLWSRRGGAAVDFGNEVKYHLNYGKTFGDSYNAAIQAAFDIWPCETLYIANDDVVLTPDTISDLERDLELLSESKVGLLGCRSDFVLWPQNIRSTIDNDSRYGLKWASENLIKEVPVIAPIFAAITREGWQSGVRIPPINWYSDNVWCHDLSQLGFRHFVSRAYVHHAGSQTIGRDFKSLNEEALKWLKENRPELHFD
jgi:GT2 family glycosyltransferase